MPEGRLALARDLRDAGLRRLGTFPEIKPDWRPGDASATKRQRRDEAVRALHKLTDPGKSLRSWSRETVQRLTRFQPMPDESSPERQLMQEISNLDLPRIGADRIRKIVGQVGRA